MLLRESGSGSFGKREWEVGGNRWDPEPPPVRECSR